MQMLIQKAINFICFYKTFVNSRVSQENYSSPHRYGYTLKHVFPV